MVISVAQRHYKRRVRVPKINPYSPRRKKPPIDLSKTLASRALRLQIVPDLVASMRNYHMRMASEGFRQYQAKGEVFQADDEVAILTDGSASRPMRNVQLGGQIIFAQTAGLDGLKEAAATALVTLLEYSRRFQKSGRYQAGFRVVVDGSEVAPTALAKMDNFERVNIENWTIYGGKVEVTHEPFYATWKAMRAWGWPARVSMQMLIGANPVHKTVAGGNVQMPYLTFGRLGDFTSRPPNRKDR